MQTSFEGFVILPAVPSNRGTESPAGLADVALGHANYYMIVY